MKKVNIQENLRAEDKVIFRALKRITSYTDSELKENLIDHYNYGLGHFSTFNFHRTMIDIITNYKILTTEFFQNELKLYVESCRKNNGLDFILEVMQMQSRIINAECKEYEISNILTEYDFPENMAEFCIGFLSSCAYLFFQNEIEKLA